MPSLYRGGLSEGPTTYIYIYLYIYGVGGCLIVSCVPPGSVRLRPLRGDGCTGALEVFPAYRVTLGNPHVGEVVRVRRYLVAVGNTLPRYKDATLVNLPKAGVERVTAWLTVKGQGGDVLELRRRHVSLGQDRRFLPEATWAPSIC